MSYLHSLFKPKSVIVGANSPTDEEVSLVGPYRFRYMNKIPSSYYGTSKINTRIMISAWFYAVVALLWILILLICKYLVILINGKVFFKLIIISIHILSMIVNIIILLVLCD
eukprot:1009788_1